MKTQILLIAGLFLGAKTYAQHTILVKVDNVKERKGRVVVDLCNKADDFMSKSYRQEVVSISTSGDIVAQFRNVPKGTYAIRIYQDENESGKLEYGLMGIPKEGVGFSKNPTMQFGPPTFDDVSFLIKNDHSEHIKMRKFELF